MSETTQGYFGFESDSRQTNPCFQSTLDYIRENAQSQYRKGERFEKLMLQYFSEDPDYKEQFSEVWLWKQWAELRTEFDGRDIGIDLVAKKRDGGYCAIQCKCYEETTRISKPDIDSFISASASEIFSLRILVNTGGELGPNALGTIIPLGDKFRVIRFSDLENSPFDWPDLSLQEPERLIYKQRRFSLKDHQREAFDDVINGFKRYDRGKLIMACGTGKTFTALRIAEEIAGTEGRVLYLVPSIGLLSQAMREWSDQRGVPHSYIGICSDKHAGAATEDASIQELKIPVTTDPSEISRALHNLDPNKMTVVFCTYQSLPLIEEAQKSGAPQFDVIFCDEAHRTTGVDRPGDKTSPFVLVHDADRIRSNKRLYMTATPKLYTETARKKAADYNAEVFSMDDEDKYGPQFHCLPFSKAVEIGELSDYKVAIFGISEYEVNSALAGNTGRYGSEININDATRIIGCWRALQNPENKQKDDETLKPLRRVITFTNKISESKALAHYWNDIIKDALEKLPEDEHPTKFECETKHVDGTDHALNRRARLDWLKGERESESEDVCRILSNARCLSEGIDVPALDAVIFYKPRKSHVDVVQAVGRVMRKAPGKQFGYVILPVAIPDDRDPAEALNDNERFSNVWSVLNALRSHDDRFDAKINSIDLNKELPDSIVIGGSGDGDSSWVGEQLSLLPIEIPVEAILSKIVEKCGDKPYWENWAKDVAKIFERLVDRVQNLLDDPENDALNERFESFHAELKKTINTSITRDNAIDMMAQHILTSPVFDALFEDYDFSSGNPVAIALNNLQKDFAEFGLENETRDLRGFYDSVKTRASGVKSSEGRQAVLSDLYEQFFKKALKKEADRLGIAYTPFPLVDFVLHSVNDVLQEEFGKTISDEGVHVLDPFTGTGTFIVQLLQSGLIHPDDLERKYREELHANEILLLAYYIAAVNIEEAFRGQSGGDSNYEPFNGIILTDTFNLNKPEEEENPSLLPEEQRMVENNERVERQQELPIEVIVGNPPWSAKQQDAADENPNVEYPQLEGRISETYAKYSPVTNKQSLYDMYKMAIRWSTDRLQEQEQGIVAFVTPATWIDGNTEAGVRAYLPKEFSSIYAFNLLGNARIYGEQGKYEGEGVFGSATQSPVAITILVKNPNSEYDDCRIHYREIGGHLKRDEKLKMLSESVSVNGFSDWQIITPNEYYDWIEQRSDAFTDFYPLGTKEAKAGTADNAIFGLFSNGYKTGRDAYIYNFSRDACAEKHNG